LYQSGHSQRINLKKTYMRLQNKFAIIAGATSGIGKAAAIRFAEEGAGLIIISRRSGLGKTVEAECRSKGARSDEASFVTGHLLLVDGGNTAQ